MTARSFPLMGALLLLAACGAEPAKPAPTLERAPARVALFDFHSGFWLNLHLRVHYAATGRRPPPEAAPAQPDAPSWTSAVDYYRGRFGDRGGFGLFLNDELVALGRRLSENGAAPRLAGVDAELTTTLQGAAALVRAEWPALDRNNRAWVTALEPLLAAHGEALRADLAHAYGAPWPPSSIRVDVSCFAGPVSAYTVESPGHITISSCDPAYAGDAALEMIFHEASHLLIGPIEQELEAEAQRRGVSIPQDLWHTLLFYTTGEIVKRRLGPSYQPYASKNGLRGFAEMEPTLRREWQPYLDGTIGLEQAVTALVASAAVRADEH